MSVFRNILLVFLLCCTGILIILPYLPTGLAGYFYLVSLAALPIIGADIICLFSLKKKKVWRNAFLLLLLGSLVWIRHYIPTPFILKEVVGKEYSLVSWNVSNFGNKSNNYANLEKASAIIKQYNPDIICLQERPHTNVLNWDSIRAAFADYPYYEKNTREDEVLNLAIFSRYPISNLEEHYFDNTYNKFIQVDIQTGTQTIRLFNVHLQTTGIGESSKYNLIQNAQMRNQQAKELEQFIQESPYPVIVCGDFNDTRASYTYRTVAKGLQDAAKSCIGFQATFSSLFKIDHILSGLKPDLYKVIETSLSDHKMQVSSFLL